MRGSDLSGKASFRWNAGANVDEAVATTDTVHRFIGAERQ